MATNSDSPSNVESMHPNRPRVGLHQRGKTSVKKSNGMERLSSHLHLLTREPLAETTTLTGWQREKQLEVTKDPGKVCILGDRLDQFELGMRE